MLYQTALITLGLTHYLLLYCSDHRYFSLSFYYFAKMCYALLLLLDYLP